MVLAEVAAAAGQGVFVELHLGPAVITSHPRIVAPAARACQAPGLPLPHRLPPGGARATPILRSGRNRASGVSTDADDLAELLTIEEVAERLRVSVLTVQWLRQEGRFAPAIKVGRRLMWDTRDVAAWLKAQRETPKVA